MLERLRSLDVTKLRRVAQDNPPEAVPLQANPFSERAARKTARMFVSPPDCICFKIATLMPIYDKLCTPRFRTVAAISYAMRGGGERLYAKSGTFCFKAHSTLSEDMYELLADFYH